MGVVRLPAGLPPGPQPGPGRRDLLRLAGARAAAGRRYGARPAGAGHPRARRGPGRRRRARRGQQPRGDRAGRGARPRGPDRGGDRQPVVVVRRAGTHRAAVHHRGWRAVTVDGRDHDVLEKALSAGRSAGPTWSWRSWRRSDECLEPGPVRPHRHQPGGDTTCRWRWSTPRSRASSSARSSAGTPTGS